MWWNLGAVAVCFIGLAITWDRQSLLTKSILIFVILVNAAVILLATLPAQAQTANCIRWSDGTLHCWSPSGSVTCIQTGNLVTCF